MTHRSLLPSLFAAALSVTPLHASTIIGDFLFRGTYSSSAGFIGDLQPIGNTTFQPTTVRMLPRQLPSPFDIIARVELEPVREFFHRQV